jgi:hypothetical protein
LPLIAASAANLQQEFPVQLKGQPTVGPNRSPDSQRMAQEAGDFMMSSSAQRRRLRRPFLCAMWDTDYLDIGRADAIDNDPRCATDD